MSKTKDLSDRKNQLIRLFANLGEAASVSEIAEKLKLSVSEVTLKRDLAQMTKEGLIERRGQGRATRYQIASSFQMISDLSPDEYFSQPQESRIPKGLEKFNFEIFDSLKHIRLFSPEETEELERLCLDFQKNFSQLSDSIKKREFERITIELSWKSSAIEGNTYSLLETETLIKEGISAPGKTPEDAQMILNHKSALDFIQEDPNRFRTLSVRKIEEIHSLLIKDLGVSKNIRTMLVRITGTEYEPIDNEFQIREALEFFCKLINSIENSFSRSLLAILLVSYIQPFEDGNKRTARLIANALLLSGGAFPLSFRSVDATEYKKAILLFYELNNITAFKRIFLEQCRFAAKQYFRVRR